MAQNESSSASVSDRGHPASRNVHPRKSGPRGNLLWQSPAALRKRCSFQQGRCWSLSGFFLPQLLYLNPKSSVLVGDFSEITSNPRRSSDTPLTHPLLGKKTVVYKPLNSVIQIPYLRLEQFLSENLRIAHLYLLFASLLLISNGVRLFTWLAPSDQERRLHLSCSQRLRFFDSPGSNPCNRLSRCSPLLAFSSGPARHEKFFSGVLRRMAAAGKKSNLREALTAAPYCSAQFGSELLILPEHSQPRFSHRLLCWWFLQGRSELQEKTSILLFALMLSDSALPGRDARTCSPGLPGNCTRCRR